tara:strand:- start:541 stop:672 length:132 start_codon:yes stop_codon:yes gene_type:complete
MENTLNTYGIEIVVGMIISVLTFLLVRAVYFAIKKTKRSRHDK